MTPSSSSPRRGSRFTLGTRELVIAFAIIEAVALLWLVTRTSKRRGPTRAPAASTNAATTDSATLRP